MQKPLPSRLKGVLRLCVALGALSCVGGALVWAQAPALLSSRATRASLSRPAYDINAKIDYELLTLSGTARVSVPASSSDPLSNAVFFLYANANGVGGSDGRRKNLAVDSVSFGGQKVPFKLDGAVLRVSLPTPQTSPFQVQIAYHGVVPRGSDTDGGIGGMLGTDVSGALGGLLGGGLGGDATGQATTTAAPKKADNTDYGLYTYGNGILSLGSFWYPQLAMREGGKWVDAAPEGLGDVAYAVKSDYRVHLDVPPTVKVVAPGQISRDANGVNIQAPNVREFAVLASEDFIGKSRTVDVGGRSVQVESYATKGNAAKLDASLDVAAKALQVFSRRFGPYEFGNFRVVEAPMKGGAGGMEYSGMVGIASSLYGDMGKQLGGMMTTLDLPGAGDLLKSLGLEDGATGAVNSPPAPNAAGGVGADEDGAANGAGDMVGGILGQQKEILDSIFEVTIAHEVGHQWWAIGVGSDSQRHPFVDESLTNWTAMLYFEDRYGKAKAQQMSDLHLKTSFSMGIMLGGGDKPANLPTSAYTNNLQYGAVIYGKGALFYDELRKLMGDTAFFSGLKTYYARYCDQVAGPNDLKNIMIAQTPAKRAQIDALYRHWIAEAHGQEDIGGGGGLSDLLGGLDLGGLLGGGLGGLGGDQ